MPLEALPLQGAIACAVAVPQTKPSNAEGGHEQGEW
jgi:hypothetical protein